MLRRLFVFLLLCFSMTDMYSMACDTQAPCCQSNVLSLCSLCSAKISAGCMETDLLRASTLQTDQFMAQESCIEDMQATSLCAVKGTVNNLCTHHHRSDEICVLRGLIRQLCADRIITKDICIGGNFRHCSAFSARAALDVNMTYTLGDVLPFPQILSDPSGSFAQFPTRYIAPETGTYIVTIQIRQKDLQGNGIIAGTPVGVLELYVNNILRRQTYAAYLTFSDTQSAFHTSLIFLQKGEELLGRYRIFAQDSTSGFQDYTGYVTLLGNPNFSFRPFFSIHYLSSDCSQLECPCDIGIQCETTPCEPCQPCVTENVLTCCPTSAQ